MPQSSACIGSAPAVSVSIATSPRSRAAATQRSRSSSAPDAVVFLQVYLWHRRRSRVPHFDESLRRAKRAERFAAPLRSVRIRLRRATPGRARAGLLGVGICARWSAHVRPMRRARRRPAASLETSFAGSISAGSTPVFSPTRFISALNSIALQKAIAFRRRPARRRDRRGGTRAARRRTARPAVREMRACSANAMQVLAPLRLLDLAGA